MLDARCCWCWFRIVRVVRFRIYRIVDAVFRSLVFRLLSSRVVLGGRGVDGMNWEGMTTCGPKTESVAAMLMKLLLVNR